jgi:hypothetical protein
MEVCIIDPNLLKEEERQVGRVDSYYLGFPLGGSEG